MVCLIISTFDSKIIFSRLNMRSSTKATILQQLHLISTCKSSPKCYLVFASLMFSCHKQCNFYFCNYCLAEPPKKARPLTVNRTYVWCLKGISDLHIWYVPAICNVHLTLDNNHNIIKLANLIKLQFFC